jgi:O-antigen/teichoic acid export membrane protein
MKSIFGIVDSTAKFIRVTVSDAFRIIGSPRENLKQIHGVSFFRNAVFLITNSGITLILGFVFWIVVARFYTVSEVGYGSGLLAATALLSFVGTLGFGYGIIRYLPNSEDKTRILNSSFTLAGLAAIIIGLVFIGGLSVWSPELVFIRQNPIFLAAFVLFTAVLTLYTIVTQVFVAFRRSGFTLTQGIIAGGLRLILAVGLAYVFRIFGIYASHGIAHAISLGICLIIFLPKILPRYSPVPSLHRQIGKKLAAFSITNYLSEGLWNLPTWILPLIILNTRSAEDNAYFYMAWSMANLLLTIGLGISFSLFAEGTYEARNVGRNLISSFKLIILLLVPAAAILASLGDKLLLVFGSEYSAEGTRLLQILSLASLPASINFLYLGLARVEERLKSLILVTGVTAVVTLLLSYILLPHLGIFGVGVSWLATQTGIIFFTVPQLVKKIRYSVAPDLIVDSNRIQSVR